MTTYARNFQRQVTLSKGYFFRRWEQGESPWGEQELRQGFLGVFEPSLRWRAVGVLWYYHAVVWDKQKVVLLLDLHVSLFLDFGKA